MWPFVEDTDWCGEWQNHQGAKDIPVDWSGLPQGAYPSDGRWYALTGKKSSLGCFDSKADAEFWIARYNRETPQR